MSDRLADMLQALAVKLGTTVEHLWPMLVAKTRLDYIVGLVVLILVVPLALYLLKRSWKVYADDDEYLPLIMLSGAASIVLSIMLIVQVANLSVLIYPEAATIENLVSATKK